MDLAIITPTLDEELVIESFLRHAHQHAQEIWIADGGSHDNTIALARHLGAEVVLSATGRGPQLNRGARASRAEILLFLHADTRLPDGAGEQVREEIVRGAIGGGFKVRFGAEQRIFRLADRLVNLRTRLTGCPLGDQAQFVTRQAFEALDGFRDWPILEDLDFARRLKRLGRTVVLPGPVVTSARRYTTQGIARTIATNWLIWGLYFAGISPRSLARLYRQIR